MKYLKQALVTLSVMTLVFFGCKKEYSYEVPGGSTSGTAQWAFTEGTNSYKGPMDTAYIDTVGTTLLLNMEGKSSDKKDNISLTIISDSIKVGSYQTPHCSFDYIHSGTNLYLSDINATGQFTLSITSIDSAYITGTFSGTALDTAKKPRTIVAGVFKVRFKSGVVTPPVSTNCKVSKLVYQDSLTSINYFAQSSQFTQSTVNKIALSDSTQPSQLVNHNFPVSYSSGKVTVGSGTNQYFNLDANGRATSFYGHEDPAEDTSALIVANYTYDISGRLTKRTHTYQSSPGVAFEMNYSYSGNLLTQTTLKSGTTVLATVVYEYDGSKAVKNFLDFHPFAAEIYYFQSAVNTGAVSDQALVKVTETIYDPRLTQPIVSVSLLKNYVIDANQYVKSFAIVGDDFTAPLDFSVIGLYASTTYRLTYQCF